MKVTHDIAQNIIEHHFGKSPKELETLGGGHANFVYKARVDDQKYIIRISDEAVKLQFFIKEQWAVQKAQEHKIPTPKILEVANQASTFPYMIVEYAEGVLAESLPSSARKEIVREMGKYTAAINNIGTSGYGHVFDWSSNQLSRKETWKDFLEKELEIENRLSVFEKHNILEDKALAELKSALKEVAAMDNRPSLNHGDMRLKNVMVNEKGKISAILDWELCMSSIAPHWDMSIALHDLTVDEKDAFLDGYGLTPKEYRNRARAMKALNLINYAGYVETAYLEKDEKKRRDQVEHIKTRLRGCFDLYSL